MKDENLKEWKSHLIAQLQTQINYQEERIANIRELKKNLEQLLLKVSGYDTKEKNTGDSHCECGHLQNFHFCQYTSSSTMVKDPYFGVSQNDTPNVKATLGNSSDQTDINKT